MRAFIRTPGALAGAALTLCLALSMTGCSYANRLMGDDTRTVPDGGQNAFGARRAPMLNPGGTMYRPDLDYAEQSVMANNPYVSEDQVLYDNANPSAAAPVVAMAAPVAAPVVAMPAPAQYPAQQVAQPYVAAPAAVEFAESGRRMPVENMAEAGMQPAPLEAPVVAANPMGYPELASVPPAPVRTDAAINQAELDRLAAERALAETARQELMRQPAAEVAAAVAPVPVAQNGPDVGEDYDTWLKRQLAAEQASAAPGFVADASAPLPWQGAPVVAAAAPQPAPQYAAPQDLMQPAPVVADIAPSQPQPMPSLEPIHLTPPPEVRADAGADTSLPSPDGTWQQEPIVLQQPGLANGSARNLRFLADNRYTQRRGAVTR